MRIRNEIDWGIQVQAKSGEPKSKQVLVRLTVEQNASFEALAASYGLSKSEACRRSTLAAIGQGPVLPMKTQTEFLQIAEEFRAIGVNLNQAVRAMNTGRVSDQAELKSDLEDLKSGLEAVGEVLLVMAASAKRGARQAMEGRELSVQSL